MIIRDKTDGIHTNALAQFVLLLTLIPFIFNFSLYQFGQSQSVPSKYQIAPDRFEGYDYQHNYVHENLDLKPLVFDLKNAPKIYRKVKIKNPTAFCALKVSKLNKFILALNPLAKVRKDLEPQCKKYKKIKKENEIIKEKLNKLKTLNKLEKKRLQSRADTFIGQGEHQKPPPPPIEIIEQSSQLIHFLINDVSTMMYGEQVIESASNDENELTPVRSALADLVLLKIYTTTPLQAISFLAWLLVMLLIIPSVLLCIKRQQWGWLIFGLGLPALYYLLFTKSLFDGSDTYKNSLVFPVFAQLAFVWFLYKGAFRSKVFSYFIVVLVASTLLPTAIDYLRVDLIGPDQQQFSLLNAQIPILVFIVISALGRLLFKGAKENLLLLREIGWQQNIKSTLRTMLLWLPMALLCIPFFLLTKSYFPKALTNELHAHGVLQFDSSHPRGFLDNGLQSIAYVADDMNFAWHIMVEQRKAFLHSKDTQLQNTNFEQTLVETFNKIVPPTLSFENVKSGAPMFGWLVDLANKKTQATAQQTYQALREQILSNLAILIKEKEQEIKLAASNNKSKGITALNKLKQQGTNIIMQSAKQSQSAFWWSINYLKATHYLALLLFGLICLKSFFYVFARVSFHQQDGALVCLAKGGLNGNDRLDLEQNNTNIRATGIDYEVGSCGSAQNYYIARRYQCIGKPPKLAFVQPFASPLARFLNKSYAMNLLTISPSDSKVQCTATSGVEFFEWRLQQNETVVFDYKHFVGMSQGIMLSTLISPKLSSLLFGKLVFSQATGPGTLILKASGRAQVCTNNKVSSSVPPERIIAMQVNSLLHVDSELDILNVYLSTAYVKPTTGHMIVDVDNQAGSTNGLARFIKHFLLPL